MEFRKFHSIENSYQKKFMEMVAMQPCANSENQWVVLEKVHGANFSYFCDGNTVHVGKRTSFLTAKEYDTFYKCRGIAEKYTERIQKLFAICAEEFGAKQITVYGELFGGHYPEYTSNVPVIQKGVYYAPFHEFYAFDLCVDEKYMNYNTTVKLCEQVGLIHAKILYRAPLREALVWSDAHKADLTTIPGYFSLPDIPDNKMEGHVLKPVEPAYFPNGSAVVIKNKNADFAEIRVKAPRDPSQPVKVDVKLQEVIAVAACYVTEQRYNNVVSKIGTVTKRDVGKLVGLLSKDALEEYTKEHDPGLTREQIKLLNKAVNAEALKIVLALI